jgi:hypothetical protein
LPDVLHCLSPKHAAEGAIIDSRRLQDGFNFCLEFLAHPMFKGKSKSTFRTMDDIFW